MLLEGDCPGQNDDAQSYNDVQRAKPSQPDQSMQQVQCADGFAGTNTGTFTLHGARETHQVQ